MIELECLSKHTLHLLKTLNFDGKTLIFGSRKIKNVVARN